VTSQFILASNSHQRRKLLNLLNISFVVVPGIVEEDYSIHLKPEDLVCHFALKKAQYVGSQFPDQIVIGADTLVVLKGEMLGKPSSLSEARKMLRKLSGKTHAVLTGVTMVKRCKKAEFTFLEQTDVTFYALSKKMIDYYVQEYHPLDKAGAYGIQDWSACFVKSITGSYHNVVGFPLSKFVQVLRNRHVENIFGPYNWFGKVEDRS